MKGSRIAAVGLVAAAALWFVSGHLFPHESSHSNAAPRPSEAAAQKKFREAVIEYRNAVGTDPKAGEARQKELEVLQFAVYLGNTNKLATLEAREQERLKDPKLSEDEKF